MKNYLSLLFSFLLVLITSCKNDDNSLKIDGEGARANYLINNQSEEILFYNANTSIQIAPGETKEIYYYADFGLPSPPLPSFGLQSLTLYREVNNNETIALEINPIIDEDWIEEIISSDISNFTLTVTSEMIN